MKTKIPNSPYPELPGVLDHLTQGVKEILGDNLVRIYLVGSLATGGFDLDSDVDFLTVILHDLTDNDVQNLQEMHRNIWKVPIFPKISWLMRRR